MSQPSFLKIMEDGIVTAEELEEQSQKVLSIFRKIEDTFTHEQKEIVQELLVESNVLNAIFKHYSMQMVTE
jgi:hypothetical protein